MPTTSSEATLSGQAEKTIGERCFEIAKRIWETPPDRVDSRSTLELKRELTRLIGGSYVDSSGDVFEIHNPIPSRGGSIETCIYVTCRYLSGPNLGIRRSVLLFGPDGLFDPVTKQARFKPKEKPAP